MHAFHSSKNISIPVIFDNIFLWKLSWIKGKRQNIYSSFLVCPRICFLPGLTRQSNWHKSNTKQQKENIPILVIHWENYPIIQQRNGNFLYYQFWQWFFSGSELSVNICYFFDPIWVDKKTAGVVLFCLDCFDNTQCSRVWVDDVLLLHVELPLPPAHDGGQGDAGHQEEAHQGDQEGEDHVRCPGGGASQIRLSDSD